MQLTFPLAESWINYSLAYIRVAPTLKVLANLEVNVPRDLELLAMDGLLDADELAWAHAQVKTALKHRLDHLTHAS